MTRGKILCETGKTRFLRYISEILVAVGLLNDGRVFVSRDPDKFSTSWNGEWSSFWLIEATMSPRRRAECLNLNGPAPYMCVLNCWFSTLSGMYIWGATSQHHHVHSFSYICGLWSYQVYPVRVVCRYFYQCPSVRDFGKDRWFKWTPCGAAF